MRDELRTPLKTITGYAHVLIEDASHLGEVSVLPDLRRILETGQTLLTRVDAMVEPSMVDNSSDQFDLESFARSIRQDVRAPLNAILGATELLLEDVGRREVKALIPDLQKIQLAAQNLLLLINSMINLSHFADDEPAISDPGGAAPFFEVLDSEPRKVPVTILIAAGNVLIRSLLLRFLTRQGDRAITADRGQRVIEVLDQHPVDLLLLDLNLAEMNGFEVLQAIRRYESLQTLPVIVIAALTDIDLIAQSLQLGAEDYLPLPLNRVLLQARINAILERKRLRDRVVKHMQELAETVNQLKHSQAQAMEANRAKSTFLANMSHELRTPLNAVIGFSQMMARDLTLTSHHRETAGIIMRSGEHLLSLINDVLSISK
ncbi:MAG TPA: histidine kinase dimerization/phospho-acceptor domain-containing protein, partial [Acidobacteriota bacterium]|nr:histidine kinase dimerization/phospho-acceptor domain-containing protein [Acidobacteriota bacterium]